MDLTKSFKKFLSENNNSSNTIKNYLSDLSTYVDYLKTNNQYFSVLTLPFLFTNEKLIIYKDWLATKFPTKTANRKLSALRKFIDFCIKTGQVDKSYTGVVSNIKALPLGPIGLEDIDNFRAFLKKQGYSSNTIKGYVSDVKYYLKLRSSTSSSDSTISRRLYSIKKFLTWKNQQLIPLPTQVTTNSFSFTTVILGFSSIMIISGALLMSFYALYVKNDRLKGLQEFVSKSQTIDNLTFSLKPQLIDPTQTGNMPQKNSIFSIPDLIDPLN